MPISVASAQRPHGPVSGSQSFANFPPPVADQCDNPSSGIDVCDEKLAAGSTMSDRWLDDDSKATNKQKSFHYPEVRVGAKGVMLRKCVKVINQPASLRNR